MAQEKFSKKKYIQTKARSFPFHECFVNANWKQDGMASIVISRKQPSGKYLLGAFMVDVFCLGVKDAYCDCNFTEEEYKEYCEGFKKETEYVPLDIHTAHNIIYGAVDYAADMELKPCKDFALAEYVLSPELITDEIDELEFGKEGKPLYIASPYDNYKLIIGTLYRVVGEDNFECVFPEGMYQDMGEEEMKEE